MYQQSTRPENLVFPVVSTVNIHPTDLDLAVNITKTMADCCQSVDAWLLNLLTFVFQIISVFLPEVRYHRYPDRQVVSSSDETWCSRLISPKSSWP